MCLHLKRVAKRIWKINIFSSHSKWDEDNHFCVLFLLIKGREPGKIGYKGLMNWRENGQSYTKFPHWFVFLLSTDSLTILVFYKLVEQERSDVWVSNPLKKK